MNSNSVFKGMSIPDRILFIFLALFPIVAFGWRPVISTAFERPVLLLTDTTTLDAEICANQVYEFNGAALSTSGVYMANLPASNGADSVVVLVLTVNPLDTIFFTSALCSGDTLLFGDTLLTEAGVYTLVLPAVSSTGCDTLVSLELEVYPVSTTVLEVGICPGDTYLFNGDTLSIPNTYTAVLTSGNGCDSTVVLQLNLNGLDTTLLSAQVCSGSSFAYDTLSLTAAGEYTFQYQNSLGCDSVVVLTLEILPVYADSQEVVLCPEQIYTYGSDTISTSGTYTFTETAVNGCDSMVVLLVNVLATDTTLLNAVLCAGANYVFQGDTISVSGTYVTTLVSSTGCDSTVVLDLTLLPSLSGELSVSICEGSSYLFNNEIFSVAGVYTAILEASNGCDSTVTLQLIVLPTSATTFSASICEGDGYEFEGQTFQSAGTYSFTYTNSLGCDSTVQLILAVFPIPITTDLVRLCAGESYVYHGDTLTDPGLYTYLYTGSNGCDSLYRLDITAIPERFTQLSATICEGGTYSFNGSVLDSGGVYTAVLTSFEGCDSTVVVQLMVVNQFETNLFVQICSGEAYEFNGISVQDPGIYIDTIPSQGGCDSILTLDLVVLPGLEEHLSITTCADVPYPFNGQLLDQSGTYTAVLTGLNGCDSIVFLELIVLPINSLSVSGVICQGETYELNGNYFTTAGNYTLISIGSNGCTEVVALTLEVLPNIEAALSVSICTGETYTFGNQELSQEGIYELFLTSATGCDSTIRLNLVVLPVVSSTIQVTTCAGTPVVYNNQLLTAEGVYTFVFTAANGCDSIVNVVVTYYAQHPIQTIAVPICLGSTVIIGGQVISAPGIYEFNFADINGCDSLVQYNVSVIEVNTAITLQGSTLYSVEQAGNQYQWLDCGGAAVPGATAASFTPVSSGAYAVQITNSTGCVSVSQCIEVVIVSTDAPFDISVAFSVYPNPTNGFVAVSCEGCVGEHWSLELIDVSGRLLLQRFLSGERNGVVLDLGAYLSGQYVLRLSNGERVLSKRLILMGN